MGGMWSILFAIEQAAHVNKIVLLEAPAGIYNEKLPFFIKLLGVKRLNKFLYATIAKPSVKGTRQLYKQILVADSSKLSEQYMVYGGFGSYSKIEHYWFTKNIEVRSHPTRNMILIGARCSTGSEIEVNPVVHQRTIPACRWSFRLAFSTAGFFGYHAGLKRPGSPLSVSG